MAETTTQNGRRGPCERTGPRRGARRGGQAERERVSRNRTLALLAIKCILGDDFVRRAIAKGMTADQFSVDAFAALSAEGQEAAGRAQDRPIRSEAQQSPATAGRSAWPHADGDAAAPRSEFFLAKHPKTGELLSGCGPEQQRRAEEMAREYVRTFKLMDMASESLEIRGINHRGHGQGRGSRNWRCRRQSRGAEFFAGGAESTSDFPAILANVANKTLRQAYEAYPRTFQPFCRQVTAQDFKPINRVHVRATPRPSAAE